MNPSRIKNGSWTKSAPSQDLQRFEPDPQVLYTIDTASRLTQVPRRMILRYYQQGLIAPLVDPIWGGYYFDGDTIRTLRRIESLRRTCGNDFAGIRMILGLLREVERLRAEMHCLD